MGFRAGVEASEVDAILVATSTPDSAFPATAARIQAKIGVTKGFAFDLAAACTGFIYALGVADSLMRTGQARCVLVITGKGKGGEGVLRRNFLRWLEMPAARVLVSGYSEAHARHGGSGAWYVFLRAPAVK